MGSKAHLDLFMCNVSTVRLVFHVYGLLKFCLFSVIIFFAFLKARGLVFRVWGFRLGVFDNPRAEEPKSRTPGTKTSLNGLRFKREFPKIRASLKGSIRVPKKGSIGFRV